jgi:hypothetical protein
MHGGEVERTSFISSTFLSVSFAGAVPVPLATAAISISARCTRKQTLSTSSTRKGFCRTCPDESNSERREEPDDFGPRPSRRLTRAQEAFRQRTGLELPD